MKYLIDSVIVIDHLNGVELASAFLAEHGGSAALSVITRAEVFAGCDETRAAVVRELLDVFPTLPITAEIADRAGALRRSRRWKLPDAMQAALAMQHGLVLVTRNTRGLQPGGDPSVLIPYRM